MTQYEMTEKLAEKMGVTMEAAKAALEACNWEMLDAALMLEKQKGEAAEETYSTQTEEAPNPTFEKRSQFRGGLRNLGDVIARIIRFGNRNYLEVRRGTEAVVELPMTALVPLLLLAFWVVMPLLVIGLFCGFRYAFTGDEMGKESINKVMDKAAEAAEKVAEEVKGDK